MAEIVLKHVQKVYPNNESKKKGFFGKKKKTEEKKHSLKVTEDGVLAVEDFNLTVHDQEFVVLVGPSGCGKSTTMRMVAGLEDITSGDVLIDGKRVNDVAPKDRDIAMVFQSYALYPNMTVYENMAFTLELKKVPKDEIDRKVRSAAEILGITEYLDRKPKALSGGQRQRVAIGRAIVRDPKVFLMDEPLSNLDAKLRVEMRTVIKNIQHSVNITTVYVTHDQEEAMAVSDRIAVMNGGVIQHIGTPKDIYQRPANVFVATFIGRTNILPGTLSENGEVTFPDGFRVQMDTLAPGTPAQSVQISVRPEEFIVSPAGGKGIRAKVCDSIFLGLNTHYRLALADGTEVETIQESSIDSIIPKGTDVTLGVKAEKINLFSLDGTRNLLPGVRDDKGALV